LTAAQAAPAYPSAEPVRKGPIVITSATLTAEDGKAVFEGSVVAKQDGMTLMADRMLVFYAGDGKISTIEAEGNVRLLKGEKVVTSERASYIAAEEKVVFTGEPKVVEGENVLTGKRLIYMVGENRYIIEESKVQLKTGAYPQGK